MDLIPMEFTDKITYSQKWGNKSCVKITTGLICDVAEVVENYFQLSDICSIPLSL